MWRDFSKMVKEISSMKEAQPGVFAAKGEEEVVVSDACSVGSDGSSTESYGDYNPLPQNAPGAAAAEGHDVGNSIPLSIFPIAMDKFCICLVGLPGRGKTHIAHRISRYLEFFHAMPTKLFNFSEYRRRMHGRVDNCFFEPTNAKARELRSATYDSIYGEVSEFLTNNRHCCTILDSTNATFERRCKVMEVIRPTGAKVLWIEVVNEDEANLNDAYEKIVHGSPDYDGVTPKEAAEDLRKRINLYESCYQPLASDKYRNVEKRYSYIKCNLVDRTFTIHNVRGYLEQKIVHFVMNLRAEPHDFYLTRHGQSEYNAVGRIGGDSGLSSHGDKYAQILAEWVEENVTREKDTRQPIPTRLWTSSMRRTRETTKYINSYKFKRPDEHDPLLQHEWAQMRPRAWHHLDELFAGSFDGMTYEEIEKAHPEEFARRGKDKLVYRYPRGESYLDVIARLEPMIIEMERHREPLVIVGHQGILRIIYAFYMGLGRADAPYVSIPLHTVVHLRPTAFTCHVTKSNLYRIELSNDGQDEPTKSVNSSLKSAAQAVVSAVKAVTSPLSSLVSQKSAPTSTSASTSASGANSVNTSTHGDDKDAVMVENGSSGDSAREETKDGLLPPVPPATPTHDSGRKNRSSSLDSKEQAERNRKRSELEDAINDPQSH